MKQESCFTFFHSWIGEFSSVTPCFPSWNRSHPAGLQEILSHEQRAHFIVLDNRKSMRQHFHWGKRIGSVSQALTGLLWLCSLCSAPLLLSCFAGFTARGDGQVSPARSWGQPAPLGFTAAPQHIVPTVPGAVADAASSLWESCLVCVTDTLDPSCLSSGSIPSSSHMPEPPAPGKCSISSEPGVISEGSLQLLKAPKSPESPRALLLQAEQGLIAREAAPLQARVPDSQSPRNLMLHVKNTMFTWCLLPRLEGWFSRPGQPINSHIRLSHCSGRIGLISLYINLSPKYFIIQQLLQHNSLWMAEGCRSNYLHQVGATTLW